MILLQQGTRANERRGGLKHSKCTYLFRKGLGAFEVDVKVRRNKIIEFGNNAIMLGLTVAVTSRVLWASVTKGVGIGLVKVGWANPNFIKNTEKATELIEFFTVLLE